MPKDLEDQLDAALDKAFGIRQRHQMKATIESMGPIILLSDHKNKLVYFYKRNGWNPDITVHAFMATRFKDRKRAENVVAKLKNDPCFSHLKPSVHPHAS